MPFITQFLLGIVAGLFLKQGYDQWKNRKSVTSSEPVKPTAGIEVKTVVQDTLPAPVEIKPDDLEVIDGIGPVFAKRLHAAGIETFAQLAELSPERIHKIIGSVRTSHMIDAEGWIAEARTRAARQ